MKPELQDFYTAFKGWAEENEPIQATEEDASALLDDLDYAGITVLPKQSIAELQVAATKGYQWPAPFGFPGNEPATECEHYYCLTERFPSEGILLMWGDGENKPEWCEWDGDAFVPSTHKVLGFWPQPVVSAGASLRETLAATAAPVTGSPEGLAGLTPEELDIVIYALSHAVDQRHVNSTVGQRMAAAHDKLAAYKKQVKSAAAAPVVESPDGWVPVGERLPERRDSYLCHRDFISESGQRTKYTNMGAYDPEMGGFSHNSEVTHWMPLPAAPQPNQH